MIKTFSDQWEFVNYYSPYINRLASKIYEDYGDKMYLDKEDILNTIYTICAENFNTLNGNSATAPTTKNIKTTLSRLERYIDAELFRSTTHTIGIPLRESAKLKGRTKIEQETEGLQYINISQDEYNDEEMTDYMCDVSDEAIFNTVKDVIADCMEFRLNPREQKMLYLRFGFETGKEMTLDECGRVLKVNAERARQIEAKALRKLRHPSTANKLRSFVY